MNKTSLSKICIYFIRIPKSWGNHKELSIYHQYYDSTIMNRTTSIGESNEMNMK